MDHRDALVEQIAVQRLELESLHALPWPPGHYYSPLPSLDEIRSQSDRIFRIPDTLQEIDLQPDAQMDLVRSLSEFATEISFPDHRTDDYRYYFENEWFSYGDAVVLHCMLRLLAPARIVEIGSGFSSALILASIHRSATW